MTDVRVLLEEHVGRGFERLLRERGYDVIQAKDRFGERTTDTELLEWRAENTVVLVTNNAKDFEPLHGECDHAGVLLYHDQKLPDRNPEGLARTVDEISNQYGPGDLENEPVDLDEWVNWLQE